MANNSKNIEISLPAVWKDLSARQLKLIGRLFSSDFAKLKTEFLSIAFLKFANLKISKVDKLHYQLKSPKQPRFVVSASLLVTLINKLDWLFDEVTEVVPLKRIFLGYSVHPRLHNTTFNVFLMAENYYIAFEQTRQVVYLNALVATLYRFPFQRFNSKKLLFRGNYYRFVPLGVKYTVYLRYSGFRYLVSEKCPYLFKKGGGSLKNQLVIKDHITGLIRGLTEGDVTKTNAIYNTDTWTALYELDHKSREAEKMHEKLNNLKSKK